MSMSVQQPAAEEIAAEASAARAADVEEAIVPTESARPTEEGEKSADAAPEKTEEAAEEKKDEKSSPHEITHGTLLKTLHGALLSFFKQKRFFYFQDDAITEEKLKLYLSKESASKSNAAYATQTGKGLWFYTKDESRKDLPHGIIKLADVTEIVESGTKQFVLKLPTGDLQFEASPTERDNWVFTLKAKIEEAKASAESVTESDAYRTVLEKLSKPVVTAATAKPAEKAEEAKDSEEAKADEPAAEKTEAPTETGVASDEEAGPSDTKDVKRSASRKGKRTSKFSDFFGGKKEKAHDKEGDAKEEKSAEASEATPAATGEPAAEGTEEKKAEEPKASEESTTEAKDKAPGPVKRHSFFGVFGKKGESAGEKREKEVAEPVKEASAETVEGEAKPEDAPAAGAEDKSTPASPSSPPKAKFLALLGKRDKSPSPKPAEEKTEAAAEVKPAPPVEVATEASREAAAETPKDVPDTAAETTSPTAKEKRKSSFFSFKKEKKADDVKSDSEETEPSKASASPVPKGLSLTSLKRKVSRAGKGKETESKDVASPPAVAEEDEKEKEKDKDAVAPEPETAEPVKTEPEAEAAAPVIGDVVPDAVTVGQNQTVQAAA